MLDKLIKGAVVVDGTGTPAYTGDVGILNGKITLKTAGETAGDVIEAEGLFLSPGFIDGHSHGDLDAGKDFAQICKVSQGVTTEICGNCGITMGPVGKGNEKLLIDWIQTEDKENIPWLYTFGDLMDYLEKQPKTTNMSVFVGHNTLRIAAMGFVNRKVAPDEMEAMKYMLRNAMEAGAMGISTGLAYTPAIYSDLEELIELCKVVAEYGGSFTSHMRNESFDVVQSVKDCITIGREAGIPVFISHHKVLGKKNWGSQKETLKLIAEAADEGIKITCDLYPYICNMTELNVCIPPRYFEGGTGELTKLLENLEIREKMISEMCDPNCDYDNYYLNAGGWAGIMICQSTNTPEAVGYTVKEYAEKLGQDPFQAYFDLMEANNCAGTAVFSSMCEHDMLEIAQAPNTIFGSDGVVSSLKGMTHPRAFATFPQAICLLHREKQLMTLEEVIYRMTGKTAERHRLYNKGKILEGFDADLVLFDYEKLEAKADYKIPYALTDGIHQVFVNGQVVWQDKRLMGVYPGTLILRDGGEKQ